MVLGDGEELTILKLAQSALQSFMKTRSSRAVACKRCASADSLGISYRLVYASQIRLYIVSQAWGLQNIVVNFQSTHPLQTISGPLANWTISNCIASVIVFFLECFICSNFLASD